MDMNNKKSLLDKIKIYAAAQSEKTALTCFNNRGTEENISYSELYQNILKMKCYFTKSGVKPRQCCMIIYEDSEIDYITAILAINACGATAVPVKLDMIDDELNNCRFIAENTKASFIIASSSYGNLKKMFKSIQVLDVKKYMDMNESDDVTVPSEHMMILYTSGSTNRPKGVPYTEEKLYPLLENYSKFNGRSKDSVTMCCLPLNHTFAMITMIFVSLWTGGHAIMIKPDSFALNPFIWFENVSKYRVTHTGSPNYMLSMLAEVAENSVNSTGIDISCLESVILAAEFIQPDTVNRFVKACAQYNFNEKSLIVSYGLTESYAVISSNSFQMGTHVAYMGENNKPNEAGNGKPIYSVGFMLEGNSVKVVDPESGEVKDNGEVGEIWLTGSSILDNYWNSESDISFTTVNKKRYFRTGDLGFILNKGKDELFIYGRIKEILNIKGENYSPHFVEAVAQTVLGDAGKAVAISVPQNDTEELVILVEQAKIVSKEDRQFLFHKIKTALIKRISIAPKSIVFSAPKSFIKTQSGKLQRNKMRYLYIDGRWKGEEVTFSFTSSTRDVKDFISEFISKYSSMLPEIIDTSVSMISLGLNSLLLQLLIAEITEQYKVKLSISDINKYQSIDALSSYIASQRCDLNEEVLLDDKELTKDAALLTDVQQAYIAGRNPEIDWGGIPCQCYIERDIQDLDIGRFESAVKELMKRHESLRTVVLPDFTQKVLDEFKPNITVRQAFGKDSIKILEDTRNEMCSTMLPIDEPLFKIVISELDNRNFRIHVQIDMICCDAMSMYIFWNDLQKIYAGKPLEQISLSFLEYQMRKSDIEEQDKNKQYWREKLRDFPTAPELPFNLKAEKVSTGAFSRRRLFIENEKWNRFKKLTEELGITPTVAFLTLFAQTLSAFGAGNEFALNITTLGRKPGNKDVYNIIGDFTKLMLFATKLKRASMIENALSIQTDMMNDLEHSDFTAIDIAREIPRGENEIYPIVFTSLLGAEKIIGTESPFSSNSFSQSSTPQVVLDNQLLPTNDGVLVCWDVVEKAFADNILDKMFDVYSALIEKALDKEFWMKELRELRPACDIDIQNKANNTKTHIPAMHLTEGFIKQCKENPQRTAIIHKGMHYSYSELKKRADQVSEMLHDNKIAVGDRVMIQMDKSFDLICAIIGTVQYGAVYVPMPYDQPKSRQLDIYNKAKAKCMIANDKDDIAKEIPLLTMKEADLKAGMWNSNKIDADKLAYIIYTSGSTGTPKGVAIEHDAAMNTILAVNNYLNLSENDCIIGLSSVSFDLSVYDIFGAITVGATLLVPTETERIDPASWITLCEKNNVTVWNTVPALMDILLDYCITMGKTPSNLKIKNVILSGDWIPMDLFAKLNKVIPDAKLTSMGGATEASIWSNYFPVKMVEDSWVSIPYGYPLANQYFHVLDDFDRLCPCGVSGKLHIGGRGVAAGYYNEQELTEKAFVIHPDTGERLYDTGDYGRYDENGRLIFMGRKDTQIKINGYRIELGEIQSVLDKIGYENNTIIVADDHNSGKRLIAFVKTDSEFNETDVKKRVLEQLPGYFVPDRIIGVKDMPITANGKIDKKSLFEQYKKIYQNKENNPTNEKDFSEQDALVLNLLRKELNIPQLSPDDSLTGWGITSLSLIKLSSQLETAFGHRDNVNNIISYRKVKDFLDYYRNTSIDDIKQKLDEENEKNLKIIMELAKKDPLYNHPVMQIIREEVQAIDILSSDLLVDLGLSSLSVIRIANRLESHYKCRPSVTEMINYQTVSDLIAFYDNVDDKTISDMQRKMDMENAQREKREQELAEKDPLYNHPVMKIIREEMQVVDISSDGLLTELGLSSLSVIRIANKLEIHYGCRPSVYEILRYQKVSDLIEFYNNIDSGNKIEADDFKADENDFDNMHPVLKCICEVLNICHISANESISSLGISSLEMIRIANKLESAYGKRPSIQELAQQSSFKELIAYYEGMQINEKEELQEDIDRKTAINLYNRCRNEDIIIWPENGKLRFKAPRGALTSELKKELSDNKEILLKYIEQSDSVTSQDLTPLQMAYVIGRQNQYVLGDITAHYYVEYSGRDIDLSAIQDAVNELIIRNEILRTVITPEGRMNVYKTNPGYTVEVVTCDENNIPQKDLREEMKDHQFVLGKWPMFDVKVTKYNNDEYRVHIGIDCLILDGWSINMFLHQFISAYTGNPVEVTDYTFRLYLEEERQWLRNKQYHRDSQKYWTEQINKLPPAPHLPLKNKLEDIKKPSFKRKQFFMNEEKTYAFFQRLKKYELTPSTALCTAYMMSLSKYSETPDVTLNLTMFNRQPIHPDVQKVLGDFTNIALIGYHASDVKKSFIDRVIPVSQELWNAIEYRSFNVINLLGQLAEKYNDVIAAPYVFTSLLDKEGEKGVDIMKKAGFTEIFAQTQTPQVILDHQLYLVNGKLLLVLDYVEQAFEDEMLSAMFKDYIDRIEMLATNEKWEEVYD